MDLSNYVEYILVGDDFNIKTIMPRFLKFKSSIKEFQVQKKDNIVMENYNHEVIKVYSLKFLSSIDNYSKNIIVNSYQKDKLHYHAYSCSMQVDDEYHVRRVTFRITNNLYVNFDTQYYQNGHHVNQIFINYNHDKNQDTEYIKSRINQIIQLLSL